MRVLFVILGEAFRTGGQNSRVTGKPESYNEQIQACKSHIRLFEYIQSKMNASVDTFIETYPTQYNNDLYLIYKDYVKDRYEHADKIGITGLFKHAISRADVMSYDFVFYLRIDLCLKDKFNSLVCFNENKIIFPFICFTFNNNDKIGKYPRVCDTFIIFPKKHFNVFQNIDIGHHSWIYLMENNNICLKQIDTMIHTYHDSDSEKDMNPLYYIVNRPQRDLTYNDSTLLFNKYNYGITKILVVGTKQTGSTLLFNLIIKLYESKGKNVQSGWCIDPTKFNSESVDILIDKRHVCELEFLEHYDFVFLPLRNPLDSAMSANARFNVPYRNSCYENIDLFEKYKDKSDFIFRYEDYSAYIVKEIAKLLHISVDLQTILNIMVELENMKNSKTIVEKDDHTNEYYRKTLLSRHHNTSNGMINKYVYLMDTNVRNNLLNDQKILDFLVKYKYV